VCGRAEAARDAIVERFEARQAPQLWRRLQPVRRVWAVSDIHVEHKDNWAWLSSLAPQPEDALVVAGDACTSLEKLGQTLVMLGAKFKYVFYCAGNHELWCPRAAEGRPSHADSIAKLFGVLEVAEAAGAIVSAALLGTDLAISPLHAWYHAAFVEGAARLAEIK